MSTSADSTVIMVPATVVRTSAENSTAASGPSARSAAIESAAAATSRRWDVVRRAIDVVPKPTAALELTRFHAVTAALARGNGFAALCQLNQSQKTPVHASVYAAAVLAIEALCDSDMEVDGTGELQRLIRHQIRVELMEMPLSLTPLWVVPSSVADRTATHVAAMILGATGQSARPWIWSGAPQHENYLLLGRYLHEHPFAASRHCAYTFDLPAIVRHFLHV